MDAKISFLNTQPSTPSPKQQGDATINTNGNVGLHTLSSTSSGKSKNQTLLQLERLALSRVLTLCHHLHRLNQKFQMVRKWMRLLVLKQSNAMPQCNNITPLQISTTKETYSGIRMLTLGFSNRVISPQPQQAKQQLLAPLCRTA